MSRSLLASLFALSVPLAVSLGSLACDSGGDAKPADTKKDDAKQAERDPEPAQKVDKSNKLEWTWKTSDVSGAMPAGTTLTYKQSGKDGAGKDVDDDYQCIVKAASRADVGTVCNGVEHPSEDPGAREVATADWSRFSPFFSAERPELKLVERADLSVPAGTFDTVQAEITGFMGTHYTVWMIADKPGVYAKVHKHANVNNEEDQTDLVFELSSAP